MARLRGHHLICLHFFCGNGYNAAFVENLKGVLEGAENGDVAIRIGADDVCAICPHLKDNRCLYNENAEEDIRKMDERSLNLLKISPGVKIKWQKIIEMLPYIFHEWYKAECIKCDWRWACEKSSLYQQLKGKI